MKKVIIALMMVVATSTASFAKSNNAQETIASEVTQSVKNAPSGTKYGIVKSTKDNFVVSTPLGNYTVNKNSDGSFSFMGVTAKLLSAKNGVYKIQTSLGTFNVNTNTATVTKQ